VSPNSVQGVSSYIFHIIGKQVPSAQKTPSSTGSLSSQTFWGSLITNFSRTPRFSTYSKTPAPLKLLGRLPSLPPLQKKTPANRIYKIFSLNHGRLALFTHLSRYVSNYPLHPLSSLYWLKDGLKWHRYQLHLQLLLKPILELLYPITLHGR